MDRGKWEMRGEVRKWTDVPLQICVGNLRPASVYVWIQCLWRIILLLTETMTVPSHLYVSVSTIRAESEKMSE
jgi:hypothetical protein